MKVKSLNSYLAESATIHEFRLKTATELSSDQLDALESYLLKYDAFDIDAPRKTILQNKPIDFYNLGAREIYIIDFKTRIPMSPHQAHLELVQCLKVSEGEMLLRNKLDPVEIIDQNVRDKDDTAKYKPRLTDTNYSEHEDVDSTDYHGEKHISQFLKDLAKPKK
jgi:hypothetical protein